MIGVTLASTEFAPLAYMAQDRFERATGLQSVLFRTPVEKNYLAKLELARMFKGQTVVYFDADLWFIRKTDLSCFEDLESFIAVKDPGIYDPSHFPQHDSRLLGLALEKYFNSGFLVWNDRHKPIFETALSLYQQHKEKIKDFGEQSCLNAAAQKHGSIELISNTFNYMPFAKTEKLSGMDHVENPIAIHGAGFSASNKREALERYENHYKFPV